MHQQLTIGAIEVITGTSYLLILLGFVLRQYLEGAGARLLWPWFLISIFGLCGLTRLDYAGVIALPDLVVAVFHLSLGLISTVYGVGQIMYAFWPELFEKDTATPRWAHDSEEVAPSDPAPTC